MKLMDHPVEKYSTRNAYQWLAMITMAMDHVGYVYGPYLDDLRFFGRLGMPFYALLFVMTVKSGHINLKRLFFIALLSQLPVMYVFDDYLLTELWQTPFLDWTFEHVKYFQLNIIFGFAIFALTIQGIQKRSTWRIICGVLLMIVPVIIDVFPDDHAWYRYAALFQVDYGWYLYATLFTFWGFGNTILRAVVFTLVTAFYVFGYTALNATGLALPAWVGILLQNSYWRQIFAVISPMVGGIKAVRPNKYLYRYFYPGHLIILSAMKYFHVWMPKPEDLYYWYYN